MRLATTDRGPALVARDDTVALLRDLVPQAPADMLGVIAAGEALLALLRERARTASGGSKLADARLLAPIPRPRRNAFCVGWNYSEHFAEGQRAGGGAAGTHGLVTPSAAAGTVPPEWPALFTKSPAAVIGPGAAIRHPAPHSTQLDWEAELTVIVGRAGIDIAEADALGHVFGYTCGNDISVRDVQRRHGGQWFKGKSFDTHLPLGPWIVTADEIPDPQALRIGSRVNSAPKQDSSTRFMVFTVARILRDLSMGMALEPGDVILTGTPAGVGFARTPPEFLAVGDSVEVEIERIGVLRNHVVAADGEGVR